MDAEHLFSHTQSDAEVTRKSSERGSTRKYLDGARIRAPRHHFIRLVQSHRLLVAAIAVCIFSIGAIVGMCFANWISKHEQPLHAVSFSPASSAIRYQKLAKHATDHNAYSPYTGTPSPEQDQAWEDLVGPVMISASEQEMLFASEDPQHSVQLSDNRGYLASLGVYHELHCLRRIRYFLHKDHYYPNITIEQHEYEEKHIDHCLEALRLSAMCTADVGLYTFQWVPDQDKPRTKSSSVRECVDWDELHAWARRRSVGFDPDLKARLP